MTAPVVVRALLEDAATWHLIALLLERPRAGWRADVRAMGAEVRDAELRRAAELAADADEGPWMDVLGTGGVVGGREVAHDRSTDPGRLLAELRAHYDAFRYRPRTEEAPDHVAVEAGFVAFLRLKEAFAHAESLTEEAQVTATTTARFLDEHVSAWAQPVADGLEPLGVPYLHAAAQAVYRAVGPPRHRGADTPPSPECAMSCGRAES